MKLYGLIGYPLTHSFSKQYFNGKFEKEGITGSAFSNFPLLSINEFPGLLRSNPGLRGLNVTIPYKEQVLDHVTCLSKEVKETGAANCIRIRGRDLTAYNTDIIGFEGSFVKKLGSQKKALILGSGGSSKAIQYVLKKRGIGFLIVSRTKTANAVQYKQLSEAMLNEYRIIINCTPLGMMPDVDSCPDIPYQFLTSLHYLFDLVYNPDKTLFLKKGEERGAVIENGLEMLLIQAEASWKIWNED